jgi:hypothetical protein
VRLGRVQKRRLHHAPSEKSWRVGLARIGKEFDRVVQDRVGGGGEVSGAGMPPT